MIAVLKHWSNNTALFFSQVLWGQDYRKGVSKSKSHSVLYFPLAENASIASTYLVKKLSKTLFKKWYEFGCLQRF